MFTFKMGKFSLWVTTEVFWSGSVPEYFECLLHEQYPMFTGYVHLHKDDRFPQISFKYPPEEKHFTPEVFKIKQTEFNSYQHRKDCVMPMWKLHGSTVEELVAHLARLSQTNA